MTDIVIPLGNGSASDNLELRLLLRSIERNCSNVGTVYLATRHAPEWIDNVTVVNCGDTHKRNKDANIIDKVRTVIRTTGIDSFVFCADDNVFLKPCDISRIPVIYNERGISFFQSRCNSLWRSRVLNTLSFRKSIGLDCSYNYESHCPQLFTNAQNLDRKAYYYNYCYPPGYTIMTFFRTLQNSQKGVPQSSMSEFVTNPTEVFNTRFDRQFVGYNDLAFYNGLKERLLNRFEEKSKYEK